MKIPLLHAGMNTQYYVRNLCIKLDILYCNFVLQSPQICGRMCHFIKVLSSSPRAFRHLREAT
jgi:hypothetical protein